MTVVDTIMAVDIIDGAASPAFHAIFRHWIWTTSIDVPGTGTIDEMIAAIPSLMTQTITTTSIAMVEAEAIALRRLIATAIVVLAMAITDEMCVANTCY